MKGMKTMKVTTLRKMSSISLIICFILIFSLISSLITRPAAAKTSRTAVIQEVKGTVHVKKAGGSKSFMAYRNMPLNQGDHISTESNSSVVLKVLDHDDVITIEEKSDLYISELQNDGGKKTKFTIWGGSMWAKATSLVDAEDEFEIETPTGIMGVRGTNLLVGVDPETGESSFFIASGKGEVTKSVVGKPGRDTTTLNPLEKVTVSRNNRSDNALDYYKNIVDLDTLIDQNVGPAIIEAVIKNKQSIDQENEEYIENLKSQQEQNPNQEDSTQEEIDRMNQNLQNLVGNIVKKAIEKKKVDGEKIKDLIEEVNQESDNKLVLDNVKSLELSEKQKQKQEQLKLLEEEKKIKKEEAKEKRKKLKQQNQDILKKMNEQAKKQKESNKKKIEETKGKALENHEKQQSNNKEKEEKEQKEQKEEKKENPNGNSNANPNSIK
jgi:hypothetical protein